MKLLYQSRGYEEVRHMSKMGSLRGFIKYPLEVLRTTRLVLDFLTLLFSSQNPLPCQGREVAPISFWRKELKSCETIGDSIHDTNFFFSGLSSSDRIRADPSECPGRDS